MSISATKTDRQISRKGFQTMRSMTIVPRQVAIGMSIHNLSRSKKTVDFLHSFGLSISYGNILRYETRLAESIVWNMVENDGFFIPLNFIKGRHVFFAIDNVDFLEDTFDGKGTSNVTALAIYQRTNASDAHENLILVEGSNRKTLSSVDIPDIAKVLISCQMSKNTKPQFNEHPSFKQTDVKKFSLVSVCETPWLLASTTTFEKNFV